MSSEAQRVTIPIQYNTPYPAINNIPNSPALSLSNVPPIIPLCDPSVLVQPTTITLQNIPSLPLNIPSLPLSNTPPNIPSLPISNVSSIISTDVDRMPPLVSAGIIYEPFNLKWWIRNLNLTSWILKYRICNGEIEFSNLTWSYFYIYIIIPITNYRILVFDKVISFWNYINCL